MANYPFFVAPTILLPHSPKTVSSGLQAASLFADFIKRA
jgi:hypothetical protein